MMQFSTGADNAESIPPSPTCSVVSGQDGSPAIVVNGDPLPPILFAGNNQFGRDELLLEQLALAAEVDTPFFVMEYRLGWHHSDEEVLELIAQFREAHPEGYFFLRIGMNPGGPWLEANPDERLLKADGTMSRFVSPASEKWREDAGEELRKRLELLLNSPHGEYFIGAAPMNLNTSEWFYPEANDFWDYSPTNLRGFRAWLTEKYGEDAALQRAWGDDSVSLDTAPIPAPEERVAAAEGMGLFRDPVAQRPAMDLQQYQSEVIVDAILHFARVIKDTTEGRALVGSFYGYLMEINNNGPRAMAQSGHLALGKLLASPDIDILMAPYSYFERRLGEPGNLHLPADSIALNGKLLIVEEDTYTHLSMEPAAHLMAPGWNERTHTQAETLAIAQRNVANFLTHGAGVWFFDLLSDGRWNDPDFWAETPLFQDMIRAMWAMDTPYTPEIAFVMDEHAVHALQANTYPLLNNSLSHWRAELSRLGAPVGYYLQSDLKRLPESVKFIILPNAYRLTDSEATWLANFAQTGGVVLYTHAAGMAEETRLNPERIASLTGFPVRKATESSPVHLRVEGEETVYNIDDTPWDPQFNVDADEALAVLSRYAETGDIHAAYRAEGQGYMAYTATPRLPVSALQRLSDLAGAHRFRDTPGMVGVAGDYLIVHMEAADAEAAIHLSVPKSVQTVQRVAPSPGEMDAHSENGVTSWQDRLQGGATGIYHLRRDTP